MSLDFAQQDFLSGSGWAGAGLLGLVLGWLLLKHLPDKDKMIRELFADRDAALTRSITTFREESKEQRDTYQDSITRICEELKQEAKEIRQHNEVNIKSITSAIESLKSKAGDT